jgi:hypothetical protein
MKSLSKREIVFLIVIALLMVTVGTYAWRQQSEDADTAASVTSFEECARLQGVILETYPEQCRIGDKTFTNPSQRVVPTEETQPVSETDGWYRYTSPRQLYSLRLPDGWKFVNIKNSDNIFARGKSDVVYTEGIDASVVTTEGGWDGASVLSLYMHDTTSMDALVKEGIKQSVFTTDDGARADVHYFEQTSEPDGIGYAKGQKARLYYFTVGPNTFIASHVYGNGIDDQTVLVEKALKTLTLNL